MPNVKENDQIYKHLKISSAKGRSLSVLKLYWFLRNLNIPLFDYIDIAYLGDRPTTFVFKNGGESGNTVTTIHIGYVNNLISYVLQDPDLSQSVNQNPLLIQVPAAAVAIAGVVPTVQTTPTDPSFSSVSLLLHMNGANGSTTFVDSSSYAIPFTPFGGAQISTSQSKFGSASGFFDGNGGYITATGSGLAFGTGDFTVEGWIYIISAGNFNAIASFVSGSDDNTLYVFNSGFIAWYEGRTRAVSLSVSLSTWHHVAVTRASGVVRVFVNGTKSINDYSASTNITSGSVRIGTRGSTNGEFFNGYIDEFRITKGVARYTANFTPPTAPFPDS